MAKKQLNQENVKKNILLTGELMKYFFNDPAVFDSLPEDFDLVVLPQDDPELCLYNLKQLDRQGKSNKPVVFVRMKSTQQFDPIKTRPDVYIPIAA
jgi:hypothetical protein